MRFRVFFLVVRLSVLVLTVLRVALRETKLCGVRKPTQLVYPSRMRRLDGVNPSIHGTLRRPRILTLV